VSSDRNAPLWVTAALVLVGIVLVIVGIVYFAESAANLPGFFPGHQAGSSHHHTKHGIAAVVVGAAALIGAWISTGKKRSAR
jgi:divalent metal cation (Fe/Co/Zn/Cd) transporter